ncbi:MAG: ATP-binding protein [Cyanobacteria bacterium P01_F01_bin.53]
MSKMKSLSEAYRQLPLHWKINVPFISTCLGVWVLGTFSFTYIFSQYLEHRQQKNLNAASALTLQKFESKLNQLQKTADLLSEQASLKAALAHANAQNWQKELAPLKPVLEADIIQIFNADGSTLLSMRQPVLQDTSLELTATKKHLLSDLASSWLVSANDALFSTLVSTAIIDDNSEKIGAVLVGYALTNQELQTIAERTDGELVAFNGERQIASTFTQRGERFSLDQFSQEISQLTIRDSRYMAKSIELTGLHNTTLTLAVLQSLEPLRGLQQTLWLTALAISALGAGIVVIVGQWTAKKIIRPIKAVTHTAQQVVQTSDFSQQARITGQDEVGMLATALNQLITWMGEYSEALQASQAALREKIQERSQALSQLKDTQSQLIQAEKMSGLGEMVAGIAHEINNPINFIHGNLSHASQYTTDLLTLLDLYQKSYPNPTPDIQRVIEDIDLDFVKSDFANILTSMEVGTTRTQEIVISLRNFARLDESERKPVDLSMGIDSTLLLLNHRIKQGVEIIKDYTLSERVTCYPAQLNQVFMNILSNALDALESSQTKTPKIVIRIERKENKAMISIRDNGPGIPTEVKAKIFDPFFTTKPVGKGTGLGLSIGYKIVQKHNGKLSVEQISPQGTEFVLELPFS